MDRSPNVRLVGSGAPVLALHGLGADTEQALGLLPAVDELTRIAVDLPGHGGTDLDPGTPLSFPHFASIAADVLDRAISAGRVSGPVPVVGVSMGAGIALTLAHSRPDLVEQLVLVRPAWLDETPPRHLALFTLIGGLLARVGPVAGAATLRETEIFQQIAAVSEAMAASALRQFERPQAVARARVLIEMPYSRPLPHADSYAAIRVPTLVLAAPGDPVHPVAVAEGIAERIAGARLQMVPRKGIEPAEHDEAVRREVGRALDA